MVHTQRHLHNSVAWFNSLFW